MFFLNFFSSYQEVQDMIVHKLMENLSDYNYSQLADLLFNLRILYEDQTKLNHFIKECINTQINQTED